MASEAFLTPNKLSGAKRGAPTIEVELTETELVAGRTAAAAEAQPQAPAQPPQEQKPRASAEATWIKGDDEDENPLLDAQELHAKLQKKRQDETMAVFLTGVSIGVLVVGGLVLSYKLWNKIFSAPGGEAAEEMIEMAEVMKH